MKFVHIADTHFDSPFINLSDKEGLGEMRRIEQRRALKKVIDYIKDNKIPYLFISGDFYEQQYIRKSTIEYINDLFREIMDTRIFIAPGNHDPFIKNSYYKQAKWSENVHVFGPEMERIELEEADIYGFGFNDFYCKSCGMDELEIKNKEKVNILVMHCSIDAGNMQDREYNPISRKALEEKGFDYCAIGHIHKTNFSAEANSRIIYPGSLVSNGFDELGMHGMIVGEIDKDNIELEFVKIDETEFKEIEVNCTELRDLDELIDKIQGIDYKENELYKICLTGQRCFEINVYDIYKLNINEKIIKIKDKTKLSYNLEDFINNSTLKGLFLKEMKRRLDECKNEEERKIIEKAIDIGISVLE